MFIFARARLYVILIILLLYNIYNSQILGQPLHYQLEDLWEILHVFGHCYYSIIDFERFNFPSKPPLQPYQLTNYHNSTKQYFPNGIEKHIIRVCKPMNHTYRCNLDRLPPLMETISLKHQLHKCIVYVYLLSPNNVQNFPSIQLGKRVTSISRRSEFRIMQIAESLQRGTVYFEYMDEILRRKLDRTFNAFFTPNEEIIYKFGKTDIFSGIPQSYYFITKGFGYLRIKKYPLRDLQLRVVSWRFFDTRWTCPLKHSLFSDKLNAIIIRTTKKHFQKLGEHLQSLFKTSPPLPSERKGVKGFNEQFVKNQEASGDEAFCWAYKSPLIPVGILKAPLSPQSVYKSFVKFRDDASYFMENNDHQQHKIIRNILSFPLFLDINISFVMIDYNPYGFLHDLQFDFYNLPIAEMQSADFYTVYNTHYYYIRYENASYSFLTCSSATERFTLLQYFTPFKYEIWVALFLSQVICIAFILYANLPIKSFKTDTLIILETFSTGLIEVIPPTPPHIGQYKFFNYVLTLWLVVVGTILTNGYKGLVTNDVTAPFSHPPKTFKDLKDAKLSILVSDYSYGGEGGFVYPISHGKSKEFTSEFEFRWMKRDATYVSSKEYYSWRSNYNRSVLRGYFYHQNCMRSLQIKTGKNISELNLTTCAIRKIPDVEYKAYKKELFPKMDRERASALSHYIISNTRYENFDTINAILSECDSTVFVSEKMNLYQRRLFGKRSAKRRLDYQISEDSVLSEIIAIKYSRLGGSLIPKRLQKILESGIFHMWKGYIDSLSLFKDIKYQGSLEFRPQQLNTNIVTIFFLLVASSLFYFGLLLVEISSKTDWKVWFFSWRKELVAKIISLKKSEVISVKKS